MEKLRKNVYTKNGWPGMKFPPPKKKNTVLLPHLFSLHVYRITTGCDRIKKKRNLKKASQQTLSFFPILLLKHLNSIFSTFAGLEIASCASDFTPDFSSLPPLPHFFSEKKKVSLLRASPKFVKEKSEDEVDVGKRYPPVPIMMCRERSRIHTKKKIFPCLPPPTIFPPPLCVKRV